MDQVEFSKELLQTAAVAVAAIEDVLKVSTDEVIKKISEDSRFKQIYW